MTMSSLSARRADRLSSPQRRNTLAARQTQLRQCLRRASCATTALTDAKSSVSEKYSCLSPQRPRNSCATHLTRNCGASSDPLLTVTHLVRMTRHPFSAAADLGTTSWTPILSMKSFSSILARWTRTGSNSSQCPTTTRMPRLC